MYRHRQFGCGRREIVSRDREPCLAWLTRVAPSLGAALFLSACSHTPVAVCPAIVEYSMEQQNQAADELCQLSGLQPGCSVEALRAAPQSTLGKFMTDYGVLRARLRSCQ
jgi:hypothetical protein